MRWGLCVVPIWSALTQCASRLISPGAHMCKIFPLRRGKQSKVHDVSHTTFGIWHALIRIEVGGYAR
jgi:hypothetical protein